MSQPSRKPHHRRPPDAWAAVRQDYASGVPARIAAERAGVSLSALRTRARREGWRRADSCGPPPPADWSPELEHTLEADPALLAEEAWLNAARFTRLGRLAEAAAWARMAAHCRRAARDGERQASAALAALNGAVRELGKPMGRMHTAEGEHLRRLTFARMLEAALELSDVGADTPAPECKSQTAEPPRHSAELHPLHTPPPTSRSSAAQQGDVAAERSERAPGDLRASIESAPPTAEAPQPPPTPTEPPPWAALAARPEADLTWAERCVRRRMNDHRLPALFVQDPDAALRRWSAWTAQFAIDPQRPPPAACVADRPHLHPGPRVTLL